MNLTLSDAFGRFGAKPGRKYGALSAMAADGAMVLKCEQGRFQHPERGVLRYQNRISTDGLVSKDAQLLGQHLTLARAGALPVRMVVTFFTGGKSGNRSCHVRPDLVGRVVSFDGDRFVVDFERCEGEDARARAGAGAGK